jgi:hypothetical protein
VEGDHDARAGGEGDYRVVLRKQRTEAEVGSASRDVCRAQ